MICLLLCLPDNFDPRQFQLMGALRVYFTQSYFWCHKVSYSCFLLTQCQSAVTEFATSTNCVAKNKEIVIVKKKKGGGNKAETNVGHNINGLRGPFIFRPIMD